MSLNAAAVQLLVDKGLSAQDIADVMAAAERKRDNTAAERQARYRAKRKEKKSRRNSNGVTPPIEDNHTPSDLSPNGENHSAGGAFPKPEWADGQVWADWLEVRKAKKAKNTATAYRNFLADIDRLADDEWPPGRLLEHAAARSWAGIYDPRKPSHDKPSASNDEIQNPYARVAARREAERSSAGKG